MTKTKRIEYVEVPANTVPAGLRWDVPARNQGQIVEVAYACPGSRAEAGHGDPWMWVFDRSDRTSTYYRLRPELTWTTTRERAHDLAAGTVETRRREVPETRYALLHDVAPGRRVVLGPLSDRPIRQSGAVYYTSPAGSAKVTADCLPGETVVPVRGLVNVWTREERADEISERVDRYEVV